MILRNAFAVLLVFATTGFVGGCTGGSEQKIQPEDNPTYGPQGGPLAELPGGAVAEIMTQSQGELGQLRAYFYATSAMNTPLTPAPTDVQIELALPGGETTPVPMNPGVSTSNATVFESAPGDYLLDPISGTLNATVNGSSVSVPFTGQHF